MAAMVTVAARTSPPLLFDHGLRRANLGFASCFFRGVSSSSSSVSSSSSRCSDSSLSSPSTRTLVLYSNPGCYLCDGLKEKLQSAFLISGPTSLHDVVLQVRDITTDPEWEKAKLRPDGTELNNKMSRVVLLYDLLFGEYSIPTGFHCQLRCSIQEILPRLSVVPTSRGRADSKEVSIHPKSMRDCRIKEP